MKKLFMRATIVVVALSCVVTAQEQKPSQPSIDPARLLLEIDSRTPPPGYSEVNAPGLPERHPLSLSTYVPSYSTI